MKNFLEILKEEIDISGISITKIKQFIPKEKWNAAYNNILKRYGKSFFRRMTISDMFKDPSEGWFFHYSKHNNKYFEGQYSFQFVQTFEFDKNLKINNVLSDKDVTWNSGNFMVDSINKQIIIERVWSGNTLVTGQIEDLDEIKTALTIAIKIHPELINYKFNYPRMKLKFVSDVLNDGEDDLYLYWAATNETLKQAYQSKYLNTICWVDPKLAKKEIKIQKFENPIDPKGFLVKLKFNSKDSRLMKNFDGSFTIKYITKDDIISYNAPKDFNINEEILYYKFNKFKFLEENGIYIYITKNLEKLKQLYSPYYIEKSGYKFQNFIHFPESSYLYRCFNEEGVRFFVAEEGITDREIIYSILLIKPNLFFLESLNIISDDTKESEKFINKFILQNKLDSAFKIIIKNIYENDLLDSRRISLFCERLEEYIKKI